MVSIFLAVFVRKGVEFDQVYSNSWLPAHYTKPPKLGNKGGVAISVRLGGSLSICAVGVHLPAGENEEATTCRDLAYEEVTAALAAGLAEAQCAHQSLDAYPLAVLLGDVNSRTAISEDAASEAIVGLEAALNVFGSSEHHEVAPDMPLTAATPPSISPDSPEAPTRRRSSRALSLEAHPMTLGLLAHDDIQGGKATYASGYSEAVIDFAPSYKFKPQTSKYDSKPTKIRPPSWCDRILWRGSASTVPLLYESCRVIPSDHNPVCALLRAALANNAS